MTTHVKRAFKYRFYPTSAQAAELSRTFGCGRKVYNMAREAPTVGTACGACAAPLVVCAVLKVGQLT